MRKQSAMGILLLFFGLVNCQFGFGSMFGDQAGMGIEMTNSQPQQGFGLGKIGNMGNSGIEIQNGQPGLNRTNALRD